MKNIFKISAIALLAFSLSNCKKDKAQDPEPAPEPTPAATAGNLKLHFEAMVGDSDLVFNTEKLY